MDELRAGARIAVREEKRDALDFALWKKAKPGEPTWPSPWGPGRPGWHIECSAMCKRYLGDRFDIHGGAMDLIFPHHENEVAQTETATGKRPMAKFWMHAGLLNVEGQKMSKSLGNFLPLIDILRRHPGAAVRYLFLQTGYRKPSNYTVAALEAASRGLRGLYEDLDALRRAASASRASFNTAEVQATDFDRFLEEDLNTAGAVGWLQTQVRVCRASVTGAEEAARTVRMSERCLDLLGLPKSAQEAGWLVARRVELSAGDRERLRALAGDGELDGAELIDRIMTLRSEARAKKNFAASDRLRDALVAAGISVRDRDSGSEWSIDGGR